MSKDAKKPAKSTSDRPAIDPDCVIDHREAMADARGALKEALQALVEGDASAAYAVLFEDGIPAICAAMSYEEDDEDDDSEDDEDEDESDEGEERKPASKPAPKGETRAERKARNRAEAAAKRGGK